MSIWKDARIPVAVALVTKASLDSRWKAVISIVLSAVVVLIHRSTTNDGTAVISAAAAFDWALTTAIAVASYVGFWSPVVDVNQTLAPTVGLGPVTPRPLPVV